MKTNCKILAFAFALFIVRLRLITSTPQIFDEESEPNLRERLDKVKTFDHQGPFGAYLDKSLPEYTDIFCKPAHGRIGAKNLQCFVENVCFNLERKQLEVAPDGYREGFDPKVEKIIELSSYQESSLVPFKLKNFEIDAKKNDKSTKKDVYVLHVDSPTLLFHRFVPSNIMHNFHDDLIPILLTIAGTEELRDLDPKEDGIRLLVSLDNHGTWFTEIYNWFGQHHNIHHITSFLPDKSISKGIKHVCFTNAVIGLSSSAQWYQYGTTRPQGPIPNLNENFVGGNLRIIVDWLKERLFGTSLPHQQDNFKDLYSEMLYGDNTGKEKENLNLKSTETQKDKKKYISVISRRSTRTIMNEDELLKRLQRTFPQTEVRFIREEENSVKELIEIVNESVVLIGMHGALMILSAFLPPGAILIEIFPFGIPAKNYTPYKTLAALPGMNITYKYWVNPIEEEPFNKGHSNRDYYLGGLTRLPHSYRNGILATKTVPRHRCCYSPFWMYRIFQDTHVDVSEVIRLVRLGMVEQMKKK